MKLPDIPWSEKVGYTKIRIISWIGVRLGLFICCVFDLNAAYERDSIIDALMCVLRSRWNLQPVPGACIVDRSVTGVHYISMAQIVHYIRQLLRFI